MRKITTHHYILSLFVASIVFSLWTAAELLFRADGALGQAGPTWWGPALFSLVLAIAVFMIVGLPIAYAPFAGLLFLGERLRLKSLWAYLAGGCGLGLILTPVSGLPFLLFRDADAPSYLQRCLILAPSMTVAGACGAICFYYLDGRSRQSRRVPKGLEIT